MEEGEEREEAEEQREWGAAGRGRARGGGRPAELPRGASWAPASARAYPPAPLRSQFVHEGVGCSERRHDMCRVSGR